MQHAPNREVSIAQDTAVDGVADDGVGDSTATTRHASTHPSQTTRNRKRHSTRTILKAALTYAAMGLRVVPFHSARDGCCTCRRRCKAPGGHPISGPIKERYYGLRTSEVVVKRWWEQHPYAQVGITTGKASGIVALYLDKTQGGYETLQGLERLHGPLPPTVEILRRDGHSLFIFRHPNNRIPETISIGAGLSLLGEGGCFLLGSHCRIRNSRTWQRLDKVTYAFLPIMPYWLPTRPTRYTEVLPTDHHDRGPSRTPNADDAVREPRGGDQKVFQIEMAPDPDIANRQELSSQLAGFSTLLLDVDITFTLRREPNERIAVEIDVRSQ